MNVGALRGLAIVLISSGDRIAGNLVHEAASRIEHLEAENARLRRRLSEFRNAETPSPTPAPLPMED